MESNKNAPFRAFLSMKTVEWCYFLTCCSSVRRGFLPAEGVLHFSLRTFPLVSLKGLSLHSLGHRHRENVAR